MEIKAKLTSQEMRRVADEIRQFGDNLMNDRFEVLLERLADKGIAVAQQTVGNFGSRIVFSKHSDADGVVMVATETDFITSRWLRGNEEVEAKVSPLLMAEFGAGPYAVIWQTKHGKTNTLPDGTQIGRGTFPNQTHANEDSWWYMDLSHNWHQARGIKPTRPLHNAVIEMISQIKATAREVYGNGSK